MTTAPLGMDDIRVGESRPVPAPDGSAVHVLAGVAEAGTALFVLPPGEVARAVRHPRVQEVWFVVTGTGRLWRRLPDGRESEASLAPGTSVPILRRTAFQFRCDGDEPLRILGVTAPPWESDADAEPVPDGRWEPTL